MKGASSNSETPAAIPNAERAGIEPWRYLVECLGGFQRQWHGPERSRLLAVELHLPVRVDVADVNHSTVAVDVAGSSASHSSGRSPVSPTNTGSGRRTGKRRSADRFDLAHRLKR